MTLIRSHAIWSVGTLALAAGLLTGCPKRPEIQAVQPPPASAAGGAGGATGVGGASGGAIGGGTVDSGAGMTQPGAGAAGAGVGGGAGATGAGGAAGQTGAQSGAPGTGDTAGTGAAGAGAMAGAGSGTTGAAGDASQPAAGGGATAGAATGSGSSSTGGSGLPAGPPTGTTLPLLPSPAEFVEAKELGDVHFEFDRADIRPADRTVLDGNVAWLRANVRVLVLVEGHCDERGTNEYNLALGERRAKAIRDYLTSVGVDAARVTVISYGKERPLCNDANEGCWGSNRRAHFLVKQ